ncbi:sushi, von Willebrand factor type A, EGF and pentraxin domain-containing protein 1-like, partial [Ruditapes philippinarum]|uniref:sushi, von Willebrand factor type A, EGF and pentraxin domain-containing protein 1-like n=1 Tax=Ruditapes philippinarum TaxID=129788 RepID=UPI00295AFF84
MLDRSTCKPCPVGYLLNSTSNQCEQCPVGQYKDVESESTCKSCPSGYTTQESGSKSQTECVKLCSPGTYSPNRIEICSACPVGYYQDEYGQTACKQCPSGT